MLAGSAQAQHISETNEAAQRREQLESIQAELERKRADFDSLGKKERDETARLRDLEQQTALSGQLLRKIERQTTYLKGSIAEQRLQLQITELKREDRKGLLARRLRHMYKTGSAPGLLEILASGDPSSALVAMKNMKALAEYDRGLLSSYRDLTASLETGLKKYQTDMTSLTGLQAEQTKELERRERTVSSRKKLVNKLKKDRGEVKKSIGQLEEDAREVADIIEDLETKSREFPADTSLIGLAHSKGNLVWPARGKITRQFGLVTDKRGIGVDNPGIDIQAAMGADVVAAAPGVVIYTSWLRGYGQFVIIDHGQGYYTLYANLADIIVETGERVIAGELVGMVGDTGSLEGPKLHFEVRYRKEQLNPTDWLR